MILDPNFSRYVIAPLLLLGFPCSSTLIFTNPFLLWPRLFFRTVDNHISGILLFILFSVVNPLSGIPLSVWFSSHILAG